ncbi:MAG: hypothetical protein HOB73_09505 [Planctomycetaceae bacterium]|jgi:hypothetical protein|nr:hypothetical protein [Planctomycetaceae bacterium]
MKYKLPIITALISVGVIAVINGIGSSFLPGLPESPEFTNQSVPELEPVADTSTRDKRRNVGDEVETTNQIKQLAEEVPGSSIEEVEQGSEEVSAEKLLRNAVQAVSAESNLQASVRHKINLFDEQLVGTGHYSQFGEGPIKRLRLELKTQVGKTTTSITQVCDGRHLWLRENFPDSVQLSRIDVRQVRTRLEQLQRVNRTEQTEQAEQAIMPQLDWGANIAMGGLPRVLAAVEDSFSFSVVRRAIFEDVPVWVILGQWKPAVRDKIQTRFRVRRGNLMTHMPNAVRIVLGRDEQFQYFPREIQYLRVVEGATDEFVTATALVTLQFYDYTRKVAMNRSQFEYQRGDQIIVDRTQAFLEKYLPEPQQVARVEE